VHELRRQTEEEFPDASFAGTFGPTREKMVGAVRASGIGERMGEQASKLRLPEVRMPERQGDGAEGGPGRRPGGGAGAPPGTAEAPTAVLDDDDARLARLERLGELHAKGILTDEEFAAEKARVLRHD
jgi:hypothetical protein